VATDEQELNEFLAGEAPPKPVGARPPQIRYTHDAMIDFVIANPFASQNDIAKHFGYTASWISTIFCSDAFQSRLAERREEVVDPVIQASLKAQIEGLVARSIAILQAKLSRPPEQVTDQMALQAFTATSRAAGYGVKETPPPPPVSVPIHVHLEQLGEGLTDLLRRRRAAVEGESHATDAQSGGESRQALLARSSREGNDLPAAEGALDNQPPSEPVRTD